MGRLIEFIVVLVVVFGVLAGLFYLLRSDSKTSRIKDLTQALYVAQNRNDAYDAMVNELEQQVLEHLELAPALARTLLDTISKHKRTLPR